MRLIDTIAVKNGASGGEIELLLGDLTDIPPEHAVDVLVVSAFPGDYSPTPNSLIGSLYRKGLDIADLWVHNEIDLRKTHSCWLSKEIMEQRPGLTFKRILCFEPRVRGKPPEVVGDIFRAIGPFTLAEPFVRSLAMPIVAAGDQGYSIATMLPPLLDAAMHWLASGLPLQTIKLVVRSEQAATEAKKYFRAKAPTEKPKAQANWLGGVFGRKAEEKVAEPAKYDVFISYQRKDEKSAEHLKRSLNELGVSAFLDRSEIDIGASWQRRIFDALEKCSAAVTLYSPEFVESKVCQDELQIAFVRRRRSEKFVLFPLYVREAELPAYMEIVNYEDCRTSDQHKIAAAAEKLAKQLTTPA